LRELLSAESNQVLARVGARVGHTIHHEYHMGPGGWT
jgi:hypothetical protein